MLYLKWDDMLQSNRLTNRYLQLEDSGTMEDYQIKESILTILEGTPYELSYFERNRMCFGNMIVKIKIGTHEHYFISDRGDIYFNEKLVLASDYHVAGEDDSIKYMIKAIDQFAR